MPRFANRSVFQWTVYSSYHRSVRGTSSVPAELVCFGHSSAPPVLRRQFCAASSAPPVPRHQFCAASSAPPVLCRQFCATSSAPPVLRRQFCAASSAPPVPRHNEFTENCEYFLCLILVRLQHGLGFCSAIEVLQKNGIVVASRSCDLVVLNCRE
jgi:hypothetical protein